MNIKPIDWKTNYRAVFGDLSAPRMEAWEKFLFANVRGTSSSEIDDAVACLCATWTRTDERPDVKDISRTIWQIRDGRAVGVADPPFVVLETREIPEDDPRRASGQRTETIRTLVHFSEFQRRLRVANPEERWDIVCTPAEARNCDKLLAYARTLSGGCPRPDLPSLSAMFAKLAGKLRSTPPPENPRRPKPIPPPDIAPPESHATHEDARGEVFAPAPMSAPPPPARVAARLPF